MRTELAALELIVSVDLASRLGEPSPPELSRALAGPDYEALLDEGEPRAIRIGR